MLRLYAAEGLHGVARLQWEDTLSRAHQRCRSGEAREHLPPIALRPGQVLSAQPYDEVAERAYRLDALVGQIATFTQGIVEPQELAQNEWEAPPVLQHVVEAPEELVGIVRHVEESDAYMWG